MFKFDFDLGEEELDEDLALQNVEGVASAGKKAQPEATSVSLKIFTEHALDDLLKALPNMISYSPLRIPSPSSTSPSITLAKRDLFDARFQLISSGGVNAPTGSSDAQAPIASNEREEEAENPDLQFVEAPSDLVPGVYEGGLKTWECSVDLAGHLPELVDPPASKTRRLRVLELGCGTAVPSLALLHDIFASEPSVKRNVEVHLQDYNELVFRLVTVPNVILAWYMSPASKPFLSSQLSASQTFPEADNDQEQEPYPPPDAAEAGDLPLTPALLGAFRASLKDYGITLRFFSGSWETFDLASAGGRYDIVLTSETIYRTESLGPLVDLMWRACTCVNSDEKEETVDGLAQTTSEMSLEARHPLCLVAAKLVYFGVGGGVAEFTRAVMNGVPSAAQRSKGVVETVWEKEEGVRRVLLRVKWE